MLTTFFDFGKLLIEAAEKLDRSAQRRREKLAVLCEAIAQSIADAIAAMNAGKIPYDACARMQKYSDVLPTTGERLLAPEQVQRLVELLENRVPPEEFLKIYRNPKMKVALDSELESAIGDLRATAVILRSK